MFRSQRFVVTGTPRLRSSGSMISRSRVSRKLQRISVAFIPGILVFANSADARSLAITEFLNHPGSTELTEWVELFNYSPNSPELHSRPKIAPAISSMRLYAHMFTQVDTYIAPVG